MKHVEFPKIDLGNEKEVDYMRAFDAYDKNYNHIPEQITIDETNFLEYIKPEDRDEMKNSSITASLYTTDGYPTDLALRLSNGDEVGHISFGLVSIFRNKQENKDPAMLLSVGRTQIKESFRKKGVGTLFHAIIFKYYPHLYGVKSTLGLDNRNEYDKALDEGQDEYEAFKATPAYKTRSKFGFSSINREESFPGNGTLVLTRVAD